MARIGFVGFGNMGRAIAEGLQRAGFSKSDFNITVRSKREELKREGYRVLPLKENVKNSNILILAVKPKDLKRVLEEIGNKENLKGKLIVTVAAGVPLKEYKRFLGESAKVIRTMPNLNVKYNKGLWAVSFSESVGEEEKKLVRELLSKTGEVLEIPESLMDAFTALAGSGPAFAAEIVDAFAEAGVKLGFSYGDALKIAVQTFAGTLLYMEKENLHPALLRDRVTSPGGTTIYGLSVFHKRGIKGFLMEVVEEAYRRAKGID